MSAETSSRKIKRLGENDRIPDYDIATQKAIEEVDSLQSELDTINEKASEEILQVEQKYNQVRKPYFQKRSQIISNIPNFWFTALLNHPDLSSLLDGPEEEDCLHHMTKLEVEEFDDIRSGYAIKFFFDENPYFENAVLTKEYHLGAGVPSSKSTPIVWKDGVQLGQVPDPGKPGRKRRLENMKHSFFTWFNDNIDPYTDDIAEDFKDDLWLNPLQYYLVADGQDEENGENGEDSSSEEEEEEAVEEDNNQSTSSSSQQQQQRK